MFAGPSGNGNPVVSFFAFAKHRVTNLGVLDTVPFWLAATRNGNTVAFDQPGREQAQIMLGEEFLIASTPGAHASQSGILRSMN